MGSPIVEGEDIREDYAAGLLGLRLRFRFYQLRKSVSPNYAGHDCIPSSFPYQLDVSLTDTQYYSLNIMYPVTGTHRYSIIE